MNGSGRTAEPFAAVTNAFPVFVTNDQLSTACLVIEDQATVPTVRPGNKCRFPDCREIARPIR
jgi:hypothetical protein